MKFAESWLRALVDPACSTDELSHALTMAGLEVEGTEPVAPPFSGVVVAHVRSVAPHPNADKLRVCEVDDGSAVLQIVCGAPNVVAGMKTALARVGAELPGGLKIGKATMRGVDSAGMLCSARELGLSEDHAGLMVLDDAAPVGADLREALTLNDTRFELKLTPNRADCLSVLGVAREVSAIFGAPLNLPQRPAVAPTLSEVLPVRVEAADLCGRFSGRVIRGVDARRPTPAWMRERLERAGQRSISALVDISNYVMLEIGRPTHVFDLDRIHGGLSVRWAKPGETLELLNGQTVTLDPWFGVIADEQCVESLAGIMGGESTAVTLDTQNVYVEAAFWWPESIAGRARKLNFSTDASHRFERGVDFATTVDHLEYLTALIIEVCGGQVGPVDDQILGLPERKPVRMRVARCAKVLGVPLTETEIGQLFDRLGLQWRLADGVFEVDPPSWRFDLQIEEDLIEEVARLHGFERLPSVPPRAEARMLPTAETETGVHALRAQVAAGGYQEVVNFSFVEAAWEQELLGHADPIRLLNPIASQLAVMRSSLLPGLLATVRYNTNRRADQVRVFELGRVFCRNASVGDGPLQVAGVDQPLRLAGIAWGPAVPEQWLAGDRKVDFFDVKGDLEAAFPDLRFERGEHPLMHPGRCARIWRGDQQIGFVGEIHPRAVERFDLQGAPVGFELDVAALQPRLLIKASEPPRHPPVRRDLALWFAPHIAVADVLQAVEALPAIEPACAILREVQLFDVWRDPQASAQSERSLALRFTLQDTQTLDDARTDACMARIQAVLEERFAARLRS